MQINGGADQRARAGNLRMQTVVGVRYAVIAATGSETQDIERAIAIRIELAITRKTIVAREVKRWRVVDSEIGISIKTI